MQQRSLRRWVVPTTAVPLALTVACTNESGQAGPEQAGAEHSRRSKQSPPSPPTAVPGGQPSASEAYWQPVAGALRMPGKLMDGGVFRISMPRGDVDVAVGEVQITPSVALDSYAPFFGTPAAALVVSDLVLLEDEVNPVLSGARRRGGRR